MQKPEITTQVIATLIACLTALSGGFHVGWASPSLIKLQAEDSDLPVTSGQGSWIASIFSAACAFGALGAASVVNKWGRKLSLFSTAVPYAVSCILIGAAQNFWWLIIARFIAALGYGATATILPMYVGEIADDRIRGALCVLINQMLNIGILVSYCVGPWVSRVALAGVGLALPIIFALAVFWIPESPYFLVMKKSSEGAEKSLAWLRGNIGVKEELTKIEQSIDMEETGTFRELIMTQGNRKALVILTLLMSGAQLSGINAILAYTSLIFEASGSNLSSSISVIIIGVVQFLSEGLSVVTVDLVGRRPLLLLSLCGSILFLAGEALYFQLQDNGTDLSSVSWLPVTAIVGYVASYAIGLGCLPFVVLSEILPCNLKAIATMYSMIIVSLSGMAVTKLYQVVADAYGIHVSFWVFVACSVFTTLAVFFILPETKQRSFRDIQDKLRGTTAPKIIV